MLMVRFSSVASATALLLSLSLSASAQAPAPPPVGRSEAPAGRSEAPAGRSEAPAGRSEAPAGRSEAPAGQVTFAVTVTLAPTWFDPAETPGVITPFLTLYALHDALVKPLPGNAGAPCLAESWTMSKDGLTYE